MSSPATLSPDTQATLLLCGVFPAGRTTAAAPLTDAEFRALKDWLTRHGRRLADLVQLSPALPPAGEPNLPDAARLIALLGRGLQLAAALERWQRLGLWVLGSADAPFPGWLALPMRGAEPPLLYGAGDPRLLHRGGLALVAPRAGDADETAFTTRVAEACAAADQPVVGAGRRGDLEQIAVAAALEAGGTALVVLGGRLDLAATARDAKGPLRDGRLVLVSPAAPELPLTRERHRDARRLACCLPFATLVLVPPSGAPGASGGVDLPLHDDDLRPGTAGDRPRLFFRLPAGVETTPAELLDRGAIPFPEDLLLAGRFSEVLPWPVLPDRPLAPPAPAPPAGSPPADSPPPAAPVPAPPDSQQAAAPAAETCYTLCLPLLIAALRDPVAEADLPTLAARLDLRPGQLLDWLRRAVRDGRVARRKSAGATVYIDAAQPGDAPLFDRLDAAGPPAPHGSPPSAE